MTVAANPQAGCGDSACAPGNRYDRNECYPPFQVLLARVIQKGASPTLNPASVSLFYSSTYNPEDPIPGQTGVLNGIRGDGGTYKTNFWDVIPLGAYDPFYPAHDRWSR